MRSFINKNKFISSSLVVLSLAYPFLVYHLVGQVPAIYFTLGIISLLIIRVILLKGKGQSFIVPSVVIVAMLGAVIFIKDDTASMLYPVIMNITVGTFFLSSLLFPPTVIERLARLTEPDLDQGGVEYTRKVTILWVIFCYLNAVVSFVTVMKKDLAVWTIYNGFISYILIGLLLVGEYVFRKFYRKKKRNSGDALKS